MNEFLERYWGDILLVGAFIFFVIRDGNQPPDDYDLQEKDAPTPTTQNQIQWT